MLHDDDQQHWQYPCDRQLMIGYSIEAGSPACRVNWTSARRKLSSFNAPFLLGDQSPKSKDLARNEEKIGRLEAKGAVPTARVYS